MRNLGHTLRQIAILALMAAAWGAAQSQTAMTNADSAESIVNRYLAALNIDGIRGDKILYMETYIYYHSTPHDTAILKRWYMPPNLFRTELWHGDTLLEGAYTDGHSVYKEYNRSMQILNWTTIAQSRYYNVAPQYDFRGELYSWKANAVDLKYKGIWHFNGQEVYRVLAEEPNKYNCYYLFEKESGLLFMKEETNERSEYSGHVKYDHPDWHAWHEYQPVGTAILPSIESYQVGNDRVYYFTSYRYIPVDKRIFTED